MVSRVESVKRSPDYPTRVPEPLVWKDRTPCEIDLPEGFPAHRAPDGGRADVKQLRGALEIDDLPRLVEQVRFGEARAQIERVEGRRPPSSWSVVEQCLRTCAGEATNPQMDGGAGNSYSS